MSERFPDDWDPKAEGYLGGKLMDDGRWWCLMPLSLGRVRIVIAEDEFTAGEHWCYSDPAVGVIQWAMGCIDPDHILDGWTRHMLPDGSFERRAEDGTPYVSEMDS